MLIKQKNKQKQEQESEKNTLMKEKDDNGGEEEWVELLRMDGTDDLAAP